MAVESLVKRHGRCRQLGDKGFELSANSQGIGEVSPERGTESGTLPADPELARLVAAWPGLSDEQRLALLNLLDAVK